MNINEFHFIRPLWLLALIPNVIILAAMVRNKLGQVNWSAVCDAALLPYLLQDKAVRQNRWPFAVGALAAFIAIIALAGPSWQRLPSPVFRNDSALVIALNLSRSMDAEDIKPSRLIRARYKIADLLKQRKDGQTALLVYAGDAFTVTPLTNDTETIASQLEALTTDIMPSPGSNTASVLNKSVELFKQAGLNNGQIVLVTDGVDLDATLPTVHSLGSYSLSVLGVGTQEGAPIALPRGGFLKDSQGAIVMPRLNTADLAKLASTGNGIYQTLTADDADILALLANLDRAEQQHADVDNPMVFELWEDGGPWLLLLVVPLAALSFRKGFLCFAIVLILPFPETGYALEWQDLWQTRDQQAAKAFEQKRYDEASKLFEEPDWKLAAQYKSNQPITDKLQTPTTATGFYNQGNVLAKSGRFEEAIAAYKKSLEIDPGNEDALYNKNIVEKELEKQKKEQEQKQQENQKSQDDQQQQSSKSNEQSQGGENEQDKDGETNENSARDKPETRPERPAEEQSTPDQEQQNKPDEKSAAEKTEAAEAHQDESIKPEEAQNPKPLTETKPSDEQQQANEQWLNRIPDDPAGLLRRKFKYQYGQRQERQ